MWTSGADLRPARISALSVAGCFIETTIAVRVGDRVQLRLDLPAGPVTLDADVVHRDPRFGFAVRFLNIASETHRQLAEAVNRLIEQ